MEYIGLSFFLFIPICHLQRSFALFLSGSSKYQSGIGSAMGMALGSLIHPDANTSVFSQVAVLWNPSLLRGASLLETSQCVGPGT